MEWVKDFNLIKCAGSGQHIAHALSSGGLDEDDAVRRSRD
jgi:hypothetical protein